MCDKENCKREKSDYLAEYTEVMAELRHYSSLRFAIFAVFATAMTVLGAVVFDAEFEKSTQALNVSVKVLGLALAISFAGFEYITDSYLKAFGERAVMLEEMLCYSIWKSRPKGSSVLVRIFVFLLFMSVIFGWFFLLISTWFKIVPV